MDPFNFLWLLTLSLVIAWYFNKKKLTRWFLYITAIFFLLISTPLLPTVVLNSLEDRHTPVSTEELINSDVKYHIVVLGGGHGYDDRLPSNSLLSAGALGRLVEGIRLHRQLSNSKLVLSGSSESARTSQAKMLQNTALLLGVKNESILLQNEPGNTYEEAKVFALTNENDFPVILVTSAAHMPRAKMSFNMFGIDAIASPTNYRLKGSHKHIWFGLPSLGNIENLRIGINEYAGMLWYSI